MHRRGCKPDLALRHRVIGLLWMPTFGGMQWRTAGLLSGIPFTTPHTNFTRWSREALLALAGGLEACGDKNAIFTFTSRPREQVWVRTVKEFGQALDAAAIRRTQALNPDYYTRMGATVRHVTQRPAERSQSRRLLLLTGGNPDDADHYEDRYAVENTHMAIREARRAVPSRDVLEMAAAVSGAVTVSRQAAISMLLSVGG